MGCTLEPHVACKMRVYLKEKLRGLRDRGCYNKLLSFKTMVLKLSGRRIPTAASLQNKSLINFQRSSFPSPGSRAAGSELSLLVAEHSQDGLGPATRGDDGFGRLRCF